MSNIHNPHEVHAAATPIPPSPSSPSGGRAEGETFEAFLIEWRRKLYALLDDYAEMIASDLERHLSVPDTWADDGGST